MAGGAHWWLGRGLALDRAEGRVYLLLSHMANYTRTYGALATVVVFLLWINLSACLLLWGAELAAVVGGFREEKSS